MGIWGAASLRHGRKVHRENHARLPTGVAVGYSLSIALNFDGGATVGIIVTQ